jgi:hypothetical protein
MALNVMDAVVSAAKTEAVVAAVETVAAAVVEIEIAAKKAAVVVNGICKLQATITKKQQQKQQKQWLW